MATAALSKTDRWSPENLERFRANKRRRSDGTIQHHLAIIEKLAATNNGLIPTTAWLHDHGYAASYQILLDYPAAFAHLPREADKKFEIYQAHNSGAQTILPPAKYRNLSEYNVNGARFNPTELDIDAGLAEAEWMELGRTLATVCQSAFWWVGDWLQYGFNTYGKKVTYDLAQQSTGYTRTALYACARVSKRFPPERRVSALTFFHHSVLCSFPPDVADRLLAEAVELGYTARQVKALAETECGKRKTKFASEKIYVVLRHEVRDRLLEAAEGVPLPFFIGDIVEEWLTGKPVQRYANGKKTHAWRTAVQGAEV